MDPLRSLRALVTAEGPPGHEAPVRAVFAGMAESLGVPSRTDAKGNLLMGPESARVVVTAHLDEIAMVVRGVEPDGSLRVGPLGGLLPWKLGECPVRVMLGEARVPGILGWGGVHTEDPSSVVVKAREASPTWADARVITGLSHDESVRMGIRPGIRVAVGPERRTITELAGGLIGGPFLDDRADLLAMLLHFEARGPVPGVLYAATAAEETGGEGALWLLGGMRPEVCVALELSPHVPDAPVVIDARPAVWTTDGYAAMSADDGDLLASLGLPLQWQALSRGGSDASCAASHGHVARPITLGLPMANSHGLEVMHRDAPLALAELLTILLDRLD